MCDAYSCYTDVIESINVSLFSGSISFKQLYYQSTNQKICIEHGSVCVQHWLLKVKGNDENNDISGKYLQWFPLVYCIWSDIDKNFRISVSIYGLEWFIYNRTPAYEYINDLFNLDGQRQPKRSGEISGKVSSESNSAWLKILPLHISIYKGAIVIGNPYISSIIVGVFQSASGFYQITKVWTNAKFVVSACRDNF